MGRYKKTRCQTYTAFGNTVNDALTARRMSQTELARELNVAPSRVNNTMTGTRPASPHWTDLVADALQFSAEQRVSLHTAAAKDVGYKLDLTPPVKNRR